MDPRRIARNLAEVRRESGLSGRDFVAQIRDRTGYSISDVAALGYEKEEGGTEKIPAAYVAAVAEAFGYSVAWLVADQGPRRLVSRDALAEAFDKIAGVIEETRKAIPVPREMYRSVPRPPDLENGENGDSDGNGGQGVGKVEDAP